MTLEEAAAHIGSTVSYLPNGHDQPDTGYITAVTSRYVFVRYGQDHHSKATAPHNLHLTAADGP